MKPFPLVLIAALATAIGCSPSSSNQSNDDPISVGTSNGDSKGTLATSVLTMTNPFFKVLAGGFAEAAEENGYEVLIVSGEKDVARQQDQVKDFIVKGVSAIALCPCDSNSSGMLSISVRNFAAASSIKSIALSGKNLSEIYRCDKFAAATNAPS